MSLGCFQKLQKMWGSHVLRVLSNIAFCALAPDLFVINFRLPNGQEEDMSRSENLSRIMHDEQVPPAAIKLTSCASRTQGTNVA
jgi:hypothetical protein